MTREEKFIEELNKLVGKYGYAIDSEEEIFILDLDGGYGSDIIFSRFTDEYKICKT